MDVLGANRLQRVVSGPVDSQHRRAMAHAAAELPELQNRASALSDLVLLQGRLTIIPASRGTAGIRDSYRSAPRSLARFSAIIEAIRSGNQYG